MILIHKAQTNKSLDLDDTSGQLQLKCSLHFVFSNLLYPLYRGRAILLAIGYFIKNYTGYWKGYHFTAHASPIGLVVYIKIFY